jgi:hypothetical protein
MCAKGCSEISDEYKYDILITNPDHAAINPEAEADQDAICFKACYRDGMLTWLQLEEI